MPEIKDIGDLFKDFVWNPLVSLALKRLFAAIPFLGWGPIGLVVSWAVMIAAGYLYEAFREFVQVQVIVMRNEAHQRAFDEAALKLKLIAKDKGLDSQEFKNAREAHKKALAEFVKWS